MRKEDNIFFDALGKQIQIGDIIARSSYSTLTFHYVIGFNRRSIKLSCGQPENASWKRHATSITDLNHPLYANSYFRFRVWDFRRLNNIIIISKLI